MFYVEDRKCTGCAACLEVCPEGAIRLEGDKASIDRSLCDNCGSCLEVCGDGAIYQVMAPVAVSEPVPGTVAPRSPVVSKRQAGIGAALVSLAPAAMDVISGLARRWLAAKGDQAKMPGTRSGTGAGRRRRRRGGR